jgi:predicted dehydrogenase
VVGVMGMGGEGTMLAGEFQKQPGVEVRYVCDPDRRRAGEAAEKIAKIAVPGPKPIGDFRRILDDRQVDVLVIAAPDHWHAPATILACAAGKHVYVEKPVCHNPQEGEWMVAAARRHRRIVQAGTQRRTWPAHREAFDKLRAGVIGRVRYIKCWAALYRKPIPRGRPAPVPEWLDWDLWQGPAPHVPYRDNLVHYNWHWFWHWGTGEIGNHGIHRIDICRWYLGVDFPRSVSSGGARIALDDDRDTPDTQIITYDFGDKLLSFEHVSWHPRGLGERRDDDIIVYGDEGSLVWGGSGYRIYDMKNKLVAESKGAGGYADHVANHLDAIRNAVPLHADVAESHKSTVLCHLGAIAHRTGRTLHCDPATGRILNDPQAAALWRRQYEPGWEPKATT